jgi:RNA polymerase sigma factor (sigma-70 family)
VNRLTDQQLLRDYSANRSEAAFAELVRRHIDFVYSAAVRMVRDAHLAEDVTQGAFVALAHHARQLADRPVLSGWLHRTAQNLAANAVRSEVRRRAHEQEAAAMIELLAADSDSSWEHIVPHLDAALGELNEADRDALLLRYFENKNLREVGQTLGTTEDGAQKRVSRAVERLREFFAKRGVTVGASGLVVVLSANAVQAAPVGLAVTISTAAILAGTTITTTASAAATKAVTMTTLQKTIVVAVLATTIGAGIYNVRQASNSRSQNQLLQQQQASLAQQIRQLQHERDDATNRLAATVTEIAELKSGQYLRELLKLRGQVSMLRQQALSSEAGNSSQAGLMLQWLDDPDFKELNRIDVRQGLKSQYASLVKKLNLSPEEADKFVGLLANNAMRRMEATSALVSGNWDVATALQDRDGAKKEMESQIRALLGDAGYAQYDRFIHDEFGDYTVNWLNRELGTAALSDEQSKQLKAIFAARSEIPVVDNVDCFRSKESVDALFQQLTDRGLGDLQQAAGFLTPEQLAGACTVLSNYYNTRRIQTTLAQQMYSKTLKPKAQ